MASLFLDQACPAVRLEFLSQPPQIALGLCGREDRSRAADDKTYQPRGFFSLASTWRITLFDQD